MNAGVPDQDSLLRAPWNRIPVAPWLFSLLVLALLSGLRYYSVLGPPRARVLFLVHCLAMWALPFLVLTAQGRREIGLRKRGATPYGLAASAMAGACCGFAIYAAGMVLYGPSPDNWCVSIRDSFQLTQLQSRHDRRHLLLPARLIS